MGSVKEPRWVDSNGPEERVVSVELKAGTAPELAGAAHVEVAHVAWLSDPVRSAADAVDAIAPFERSPALLRVGRKMWELGCPYIHELRSISARCSADDVARLAQLSFGEAIADGSDLVPALPAPALCASGVPDGAASPSALLGRGRICGCSTDLGPVCAVPASGQTVEEACWIGYPARHEGRRERILAR